MDMNFTEFWYLGKPAERAEYRRRKRGQNLASLENKKAQAVVAEIHQHKRMKQQKKHRKRKKTSVRNRRYRLRR
ncbi:hypothetical protein F4Z99_09580 [Candidatus Poribacteria bacterium]|nr:hypothetical protein [Candidatus Poribacteria bacterium]